MLPKVQLAPSDLSRARVCHRCFRWKFTAVKRVPLRNFGRESVLFLFFGIFLSGCRFGQSGHKPSIEFTKVPPAGEGGPDKTDTIEGRAVGARSGQQLVLYARSGQWWVQPVTNEPFTRIQPDSKWSNSTHLGTEYAALLVEPGYRPAPKIAALPTEGGAVVAVATVGGRPGPREVIKILHFSGYEWKVRTASSNWGAV